MLARHRGQWQIWDLALVPGKDAAGTRQEPIAGPRGQTPHPSQVILVGCEQRPIGIRFLRPASWLFCVTRHYPNIYPART